MTHGWHDDDGLLALPPPWAHLAPAAASNVESVLRLPFAGDAGVVVRFLRGERCATKRDLLREWAALLQFPYYFGENWDAFNDCINDLEWLPARAYIFGIIRADRILFGESGFDTFVQILDSAAARWADDARGNWPGHPIPFHVVFQTPPERESETRARFERCGIVPATLRLP